MCEQYACLNHVVLRWLNLKIFRVFRTGVYAVNAIHQHRCRHLSILLCSSNGKNSNKSCDIDPSIDELSKRQLLFTSFFCKADISSRKIVYYAYFFAPLGMDVGRATRLKKKSVKTRMRISC